MLFSISTDGCTDSACGRDFPLPTLPLIDFTIAFTLPFFVMREPLRHGLAHTRFRRSETQTMRSLLTQSHHWRENHRMYIVTDQADLSGCDLSKFRRFAIADDPESSYVMLWSAPERLGKPYASNAAATISSHDDELLIIAVSDVDDIATRQQICAVLRPFLVDRHGSTENGWVGPSP